MSRERDANYSERGGSESLPGCGRIQHEDHACEPMMIDEFQVRLRVGVEVRVQQLRSRAAGGRGGQHQLPVFQVPAQVDAAHGQVDDFRGCDGEPRQQQRVHQA